MVASTSRRRLLHGAGVVAAGALLAMTGCAAPEAVRQTVQSDVWRGRLGLQVFDTDGSIAQSLSASFFLQGNPQQGLLEVFNPLGNQVARLQWQPQRAWLQQGQKQWESPSLAELVERSLGAEIPIAALFAWLQGHSAQAQGWQADLSRYHQGRIVAQRLQPLPRTQLRVVLQEASAAE